MAIPHHIDPAAADHARRAREFSGCLWLLQAGRGVTDGLPVDGLTHALQCATRASQAGADEALVVAALLHDMAKPLGMVNHPAISAEILRGRLADDIVEAIRWHGEFQEDINHGRTVCDRYHGEPWYDAARRLAAWDAKSFEVGYPALPLEEFVPALRRLYRLDD